MARMETIADRVRSRLKLFPDMDQDILAARCGTSQASISRLMSGKIDSPEYIYELSLALVTSVQWLKTGIEDKPLEFMLQWKRFIDAFEASPPNIQNSIRLQLGLDPINQKISSKERLPNGNTGSSHG